MSSTQKYIIIMVVIILFAIPLFVEPVGPGEKRVDNRLEYGEETTVEVVDITCQLTEKVQAAVKVALLPETEYTVNDKHVIAESVCGVLEHNGALIFDITYEVAE